MSLEALYGPFASVFEKGELEVPGHLELLHLAQPGAQIVIDRIAVVLRHAESSRWATALLHDRNWRPHLVGAIALLLEPSLGPELLWHAIDEGSWVTPQLVATAMFLDTTFREQVRRRAAALCPVGVHAGTSAGKLVHSPKMMASLIAASAELPDLAVWREACLRDERVQKLLAEDASWDRSDRITTTWLAAVRASFLVRGRTLTTALDESSETG